MYFNIFLTPEIMSPHSTEIWFALISRLFVSNPRWKFRIRYPLKNSMTLCFIVDVSIDVSL